MLDIKEGQFAISENRYGFGVCRADKVTAKQIRSLRWGNRYAQTDRSTVIAVRDTKEGAQSLMDRLDNARRTFGTERSAAVSAFNKAVEPFEVKRDKAIAEAQARFRQKVEKLVASVDGSAERQDAAGGLIGEADDSAVPAQQGDAQPHPHPSN